MVVAQFIKMSLCALSAVCILMHWQTYAVEHIAPTAHSTIIENDIKRLAPGDEIKTIELGDTPFLTLHREYMSADFRGVVILIPDWQSSPTNNSGMNFLRKELNNHGYSTYAMTVPDINWQAAEQSSEANNQPTAADNSTPTEPPHHVDYIEQVNIEVLDNYKTNLIARYEALYQQASEASNEIVVIAQGTSAGVLIEHYADFSDLQINAFISLSSFLPNSQRNARLSKTTSLVTPALLDIYFSGDHNDILMNLKNRQRWVNRNAKFDYRQRQLFGLRDAPQQHARLSKEIDGFLRRLF